MQIFSYGECLIRYDFSPDAKLDIFPTGTSLNFLANLNQLGIKHLQIVTGLSSQDDANIFIDKFKQEKIGFKYAFSHHWPMGSYQLYRLKKLKNWSVVYNRNASIWQIDDHDIKTLPIVRGDYFHFDGISLLVSKNSQIRTLNLLAKVYQKTTNILFDFNYRKRLIQNQQNYLPLFKQIFTKIKSLNISKYDFMEHFNLNDDFNLSLQNFAKKYPNIEYIFGTWKANHQQGLKIQGFMFNNNQLTTSREFKYQPKDLIGQGDAFFAHMCADLLLGKKPDLNQAILWSIFKLNFMGDASIPKQKDFYKFIKTEWS